MYILIQFGKVSSVSLYTNVMDSSVVNPHWGSLGAAARGQIIRQCYLIFQAVDPGGKNFQQIGRGGFLWLGRNHTGYCRICLLGGAVNRRRDEVAVNTAGVPHPSTLSAGSKSSPPEQLFHAKTSFFPFLKRKFKLLFCFFPTIERNKTIFPSWGSLFSTMTSNLLPCSSL